jgi:hypothetical protein
VHLYFSERQFQQFSSRHGVVGLMCTTKERLGYEEIKRGVLTELISFPRYNTFEWKADALTPRYYIGGV